MHVSNYFTDERNRRTMMRKTCLGPEVPARPILHNNENIRFIQQLKCS